MSAGSYSRGYSCLSKRSADLETSDIDLSALRIYLRDGSHRTVSTSADMSCGEVLDKVLLKLDLTDQRDQYGLCLKYMLAEPRIADDNDVVGDLNPNVWDRLDRIYLSRKDPGTLLETVKRRRKIGVVGLRGRVMETDSEENRSESMITSINSVTWTDNSEFKCVTNQKVAASFSNAWTDGVNIMKDENEMDHPRIEEDLVNADDDDEVFSSIYSSRSKPFANRQPKTCLPQFIGGFYSCASNNVNSLETLGSDRLSVCSQKSSGVYEDVESWLAPLSPHSSSSQSTLTGKQKRDSGVLSITESDEGACNVTEEYVAMGQAPVTVPIRDDSSRSSASPTHDGNTSQMMSYKSMELLTSDVIEDISSFALEDPSPSHSSDEDDETIRPRALSSHSFDKEDNAAPVIPPRVSSLVKSNQLITDKELIKQGQRLSQVLNITPVVPKRKISLAAVKNTVTKLLKHHTSASAMKQPFRKLSNEKQSSGQKRKLRSSVSTTSLPTSRINNLDCTPNESYDHLSSWTGSSLDLNHSSHHRQLQLTSSYNPSSQYTSSSDSNLRRCAVSVDNVCDLDGYSPRSSMVASDGYVSPQPTCAWSASDDDDSYIPMVDQFRLEDEQEYENVRIEEDSDYENFDSQEDEYVEYDPQLEEDYVSINEDEAEYKYINACEENLLDPLQISEQSDYENFNPQGTNAWRLLISDDSEKESHRDRKSNTSVATVEEKPLESYVEMKTWAAAEQKDCQECISRKGTSTKCQLQSTQKITNNEQAEENSRKNEESNPYHENVPISTTKRVTRNFSAKFHFHAPPPPPQFLPKLSCHIEEDEELEGKIGEEDEQLSSIVFQSNYGIRVRGWEKQAVKRFESCPINPTRFSSLSLQAAGASDSPQAVDCHTLPQPSSLARNTRTASSRQIRRWSHGATSAADPSLKSRRTSDYQLRRSTPLTRKNMSKIHLNWMRTSGLGLK